VFRFSAHPATITVTQGIQDAFNYLSSTWKTWLPVVLVISGCAFLVALAFGTVDTSSIYYQDQYSGRVVWRTHASTEFWRLMMLSGLSSLATLVGGWIFIGTAIAGLRHQRLTASIVVTRGLLTIVYGLMIAAVAIPLALVWAIILVAAPALGILLVFAVIPVVIYFAVRLVFASLAIFDGFGPIAAITETWQLSSGSVLRLFGWGLMAFLITLAFSIMSGIASAPFSASGAAPFALAISSGIGSVVACVTVYMMAVLYESQRARRDPNLYGPVPYYGGYGYPSAPPVIPGWGDPNAPPAGYGYPPRAPAVNVWQDPNAPPAGWGYPPQPPAGSGWVAPSAPPPGYGYPPQPPAFRYPGTPPPGPGWANPGTPPPGYGYAAPPPAGPAPAPTDPTAAPVEPPAPEEPPSS
jgi:hypothetical protein